MTQEDKQLLLKDLCTRLPYGVIIEGLSGPIKLSDYYSRIDITKARLYKPYLRPMSSMKDEEKDNLQSLHDIISNENYGDGYSPSAWNAITEWEDYCNARHLDYRGLIPIGLALEAPEGMYKTE